MLTIQNIAGYKFVNLTDPASLRMKLLTAGQDLGIKGTILLSHEGINLSLAGSKEAIASFKMLLQADACFAGMSFRESYSATQPFRRMKVKLKKEIITMRLPMVQPGAVRAPSISAQEFKQWLDENRDISLVDTRNGYEVQFGTFKNAIDLKIKDFSEFPEKSDQLDKDKTIVMFCTGGIRCEKAAIHLMQEGFKKVYQLEGGILNYFAEIGGAHYHGDCFVFDERVALDPQLQKSGAEQCRHCQYPIQQSEQHHCYLNQ